MLTALYGLAVFNLHWWGFGVPFVLVGAWYLVRAYRAQRALKEATGVGREAAPAVPGQHRGEQALHAAVGAPQAVSRPPSPDGALRPVSVAGPTSPDDEADDPHDEDGQQDGGQDEHAVRRVLRRRMPSVVTSAGSPGTATPLSFVAGRVECVAGDRLVYRWPSSP